MASTRPRNDGSCCCSMDANAQFRSTTSTVGSARLRPSLTASSDGIELMFAFGGPRDKPNYDCRDVKALVWHGPNAMAVEDVEDPVPRAGEVVIRSHAAGICGSEVEGYLGLMPNRVPPLVMGHEFAGVVAGMGQGVDPRWNGKRVAINPIVGCGHCRYCTAGRRNLCPERLLVGVASPGGFASAVVVP